MRANDAPPGDTERRDKLKCLYTSIHEYDDYTLVTRAESAVEAMCSLNQSCIYIIQCDHAPIITRVEKKRSGDYREAADSSSEFVASTTLPA